MENINISFAPDTSAVGEKRISDIENYLALLSERIRFCFENIGEEQASKQDESKNTELILSALSDGVGEFTNSDKNCEIFNDYANGVSMKQIVEELNGSGVKTSKGNDFTINSIRTILQNRSYLGEYRYADIVVADGMPRIISDELFEAVHFKGGG